MQIRYAVVHRIQKEQHEAATKVHLRDSLLPLDEALTNLMTTVLRTYNQRSARSYGVFDGDTTRYPFSTWVEEHTGDRLGFLEFSHVAVRALEDRMRSVPASSGGYLLFVRYQATDDNVMLLVLNDIDGTAIDPATLTVQMAPHLDVSHLRLAARVNLAGFASRESGYLSFVLGRGNRGEVSSYFRAFLGCADQRTAKHHTASLRRALHDYTRAMAPDSAQQVRDRTYEHLSARLRADEDVFLEDLARYLFPDAPEDFVQFANGDTYKVQSVFRPDATEIRRLRRIEWRSTALRVDFDRSLLHTGQVKWDREQNRLTLTDVPDAIVQEITEELGAGQ